MVDTIIQVIMMIGITFVVMVMIDTFHEIDDNDHDDNDDLDDDADDDDHGHNHDDASYAIPVQTLLAKINAIMAGPNPSWPPISIFRNEASKHGLYSLPVPDSIQSS